MVKTIDELKEIATNDGFNPNVTLLKKYFQVRDHKVGDIYYPYYCQLKASKELLSIKKLIVEQQLKARESEIIFFTILLFMKYNMYEQFREDNRHFKNDKAHKEKKRLWSFFTHLTKTKKVTLKHINFVVNEDKAHTIKSEYLNNYLISIIKDKLEAEMPFTEYYLSQNNNIKKSQYTKKFKTSFRPFVSFLKNETKKFKHDIEAYTFINNIFQIINPKMMVQEEKLKDALKPKKK